jgi:hypothetical protein
MAVVPRAPACTRAREIIEEFPPSSMIDSVLLSLILRSYAADGATGLVGAALTSETTLSISAAATGSKKRTSKARTGSKADRNPTPSAPNITKRWGTA